MSADAPTFVPWQLRRLVPSGSDVELTGPGTRFTPGQLVDESVGTRPGPVLQLAASNR